MKAILLSTSDIQGGAARAAYRLHQGLNSVGVDSWMLVQSRNSDDPKVKGPRTQLQRGLSLLRPSVDALAVKASSMGKRLPFSTGMVPDRVSSTLHHERPHIVHLHWIAGGFLRIESMDRFHVPIVWTLHDMWPFTGGCHYSGLCTRYRQSCGLCPVIGSSREHDLSRWNLLRKRRVMEQLDLTVVAPSRWIASCARSSSILQNLRIEVIPNGLDLKRYRPLPSGLCRDLLGLPNKKKLIGFGAIKSTQDKRKGFDFLIQALRALAGTPLAGEAEVVIFGASQPDPPIDLGLRAHFMGTLNDDISLAHLYAACDIFVAPSTEDNLPNTLIEAMACGTPCVAFRTGGIPDLIEHQSTGYLAKPFDVEDLALGMVELLSIEDCLASLSRRARQKAEREYSLEVVAERHRHLYNEILGTRLASTMALNDLPSSKITPVHK